DLGETGGSEAVSLLESEMPAHTHVVMANENLGNTHDPAGNLLGRSGGAFAYQSGTTANLVPLSPASLAPAGGDQPHNNLQPYLTFNFCIALQGVYPPRT